MYTIFILIFKVNISKLFGNSKFQNSQALPVPAQKPVGSTITHRATWNSITNTCSPHICTASSDKLFYITDSLNGLGWKGPLRSYSSNPPAIGRDTSLQTRLVRAPFSLALNASREGASTTSLGNLFQCLTTLTVQNFFLISSLNLPSSSLKLVPLVLLLHALIKSPSSAFLWAPFRYWKVPSEPSFLQAEGSPSSQPVLRGEVLQPADLLHGLPLYPTPTAPCPTCVGGSKTGQSTGQIEVT